MLSVRPYRSGDAKVIISWCQDEDAFYKWSAGILGEYPLSEARFQEANAGRIDNENYFPFVMTDEGKVVGYFILRKRDPADTLLRVGFVIVDPSIRGKGYGKKMLTLGAAFARDVYGATGVTLGVFDNNPSALHCYEAVGFKSIGEEEVYAVYGRDWKCIEMEMLF